MLESLRSGMVSMILKCSLQQIFRYKWITSIQLWKKTKSNLEIFQEKTLNITRDIANPISSIMTLNRFVQVIRDLNIL
jgi:hypothetical protein